jgi:TRAP-type C4-dicarboxylate transport system permease large subunit
MERGNIGGNSCLVDLFVGRIRGGLGAVAVVSCAVFGSITGSCCATLSCIGSIMFPRLEKAGYSKGYAAALLANASVLGILIPPSAIMILYSWVGGQSVLACFLANGDPPG